LHLAWNRVRDEIVIGPDGGPLGVLWNGSGTSVNVLGLLLRWLLVRIGRYGGGHRGLLRNIGRWDWSDVADVQVHVSRRLLGLGVALLLEGRDDRRKDGLNLRLERLLRLGMALLLEGRSDCRKDGLKLCLGRLSYSTI